MFSINLLKYNVIPFDELVINLDRLSRFKLPEESFLRVFHSIIFKHLIYPKFSKKNIQDVDVSIIIKIVEKIWNNSVKETCGMTVDDDFVFNTLISTIKSMFHTSKTDTFLNIKLCISPILKKVNYEKSSDNIKFLIKVMENCQKQSLDELQLKYSLTFPIKKLLIAEGITEEILLPVFADKMNKNFKKNGIFIMGAGGKSKSSALYIKFRDKLKIPIVLLFDRDAEEICKGLTNVLYNKDKVIMLKKGEFEDLLPLNLIKRTLNKEYEIPISVADLRIYEKMCDNLEHYYRFRHLGEFKKVKFAKIVAKNIKYDTDISEEIKNIISLLI